jgi:hypothetical protein
VSEVLFQVDSIMFWTCGCSDGYRPFHCLTLWHILLGVSILYVGHRTTSQKVTGVIPDGVIEIFHWHNPSSHTTALGFTQPLTEMSTRNISSGVKAASVYGWRPYHLHVPSVLKSGSFNFLEPSGSVRPIMGLIYGYLYSVCISCVPLWCFSHTEHLVLYHTLTTYVP